MDEHECATETNDEKKYDNTVKSRFFKCKCTCNMSNQDVWQCVLKAAENALTELGPHQSESIYEQSIAYFLYQNNVTCMRQVPVYESNLGRQLMVGIIDIEVGRSVVVELKSNHDRISDNHIQQIYRYKRAYAKNPVFDEELLFAVILFARSNELQIYIAK